MSIPDILSFSGRISRQTYWLSMLCLACAYVIVILLRPEMNEAQRISGWDVLLILLYIPTVIVLIWLSLTVQVKRWHDRDKSGWWMLIGIIPIIGSIWAFIELGLLAGTPGPNFYGDAPLV